MRRAGANVDKHVKPGGSLKSTNRKLGSVSESRLTQASHIAKNISGNKQNRLHLFSWKWRRTFLACLNLKMQKLNIGFRQWVRPPQLSSFTKNYFQKYTSCDLKRLSIANGESDGHSICWGK